MSAQPPRSVIDADLHAFVDGQIDFERRALVVQAMASDPEIRARVETWRRQNEALTATFGAVLMEPVPLRLMPTNLARGKIKSVEPKGAQPSAGSERPSAPSLRLFTIAVAAFVAGGAVVYVMEALTSATLVATGGHMADLVQPSGTRALAARAYEAHRTYATDLNHAVEVPASDSPRLVKWIQHRLSMAVRLPDLRHEGWSLVGGRVLPSELGPAAFLIYANGVERIGLYMARTNARQADALSIFDNGAGLGSVAYWVDEPVGYALTTSRDATWLERYAPTLNQSIKTQVKDNAAAE